MRSPLSSSTFLPHAIAAFLAHARDAAGSVVINGDLFDFWFEWKTVIPRRSFRALPSPARWLGGSWKRAASASSAVLNQISATVRS